jgi:para-nitrobenzyl esterase
MKQPILLIFLLVLASFAFAQLNIETKQPQVQTSNGILEGVNSSGIKIFKGIPFAKPPVGSLRWREPQPVESWKGIRKADKFGPRAMQLPLFSDMVFRSDGLSEDCLYLNIWTPAKSSNERLPVLVYFFGGGFVAGDGSEFRYEGESMARNGIVAITVNQRLGVFGFMAHPDLSKESSYHGSGNYGLMDQAAALKWIQKNIASFGGDPKKVTIAGESAGSYSVSAQMASPLSKNLIAGAIAESGSLLSFNPTTSLADAEKIGAAFANRVGAKSLAELRAIPAQQLLDETSKPESSRFPVNVDGYFFPKSPEEIFSSGEQAHVPLLVGWNSEEGNYRSVIGEEKATVENYIKGVKRMVGDEASEILQIYKASTDAEVEQAGTDLASDMFIGFSTWKLSDLQSRTGGRPVYRYLYSRPRPLTKEQSARLLLGQTDGSLPKDTLASAIRKQATLGAGHSIEIEYAMGNLPTNRVYDWQPEDFKISEIMQGFFINFIKTGNPNGTGLPQWPSLQQGKPASVMQINVNTMAETEKNRERYLYLDSKVER